MEDINNKYTKLLITLQTHVAPLCFTGDKAAFVVQTLLPSQVHVYNSIS